MGQGSSNVVHFSNTRWFSQPAALHLRHGSNIKLSANDNVAQRRVNWNNGGVVLTAEPVPVGTMFQVTVLEKGIGWPGNLVSVVDN